MEAIFVHDGHSIDYTPAAAVAAGDVVVQSELVGIAKLDIPANALGALAVTGVFDVEKSTATFAFGDKVYWSTASSQAVSTASGNTLMGKAVADAATGDATVRVRLNQ